MQAQWNHVVEEEGRLRASVVEYLEVMDISRLGCAGRVSSETSWPYPVHLGGLPLDIAPPTDVGILSGRIGKLRDALNHGDQERAYRKIATLCRVLRFSDYDNVDTLRDMMVSVGAVRLLMSVNEDFGRCRAYAARAIGYLARFCRSSTNLGRRREEIVASGAISMLAGCIRWGSPLAQEHAVAALDDITECSGGRNEFLKGAVPGLLAILRFGSNRGKSKVASLFYNLSLADLEEVAPGSLEEVLAVVFAVFKDQMVNDKNTIAALLAIVTAWCEDTSKSMIKEACQCADFVPVLIALTSTVALPAFCLMWELEIWEGRTRNSFLASSGIGVLVRVAKHSHDEVELNWAVAMLAEIAQREQDRNTIVEEGCVPALEELRAGDCARCQGWFRECISNHARNTLAAIHVGNDDPTLQLMLEMGHAE
jgi:hypothetical protein